jgi:ATP-dependent protease HslVU (ClpYQ) peptidase subunit
MTCIVGLKTEDGIYIGGDSAVSTGDNLVQTMADPKVWTKGQFIFGYAGTLRAGQIIKYNFKIPPICDRDSMEYLVIGFVDAMRKTLKKAGAAKEENKEEEQSNQFLIGYKGRLFEIDEGYGVCEVADEFTAIGSGTEYALGSLQTTKGLEPDYRIIKALEAAAHFTSWVRPPFHTVKQKLKK